jgi:hypothetical protein
VKRAPQTSFIKVLAICLCLSVTAGGQSGSLLGNLPIVGGGDTDTSGGYQIIWGDSTRGDGPP